MGSILHLSSSTQGGSRSSVRGTGVTASVRVLFYVDERHTGESTIREDYIGCMNRGIQEALQLGLSQESVDKVVRPHVPQGIDAPAGFVGEI